MKSNIFIPVLLVLLMSCSLDRKSGNQESAQLIECTVESINYEISKLSESSFFMDTIFHLNKREIELFNNTESIEIAKSQREDIMLKLMARLNDEKGINTTCKSSNRIDLKVGDIALFCLAKIEKLPFALATGRQNCTEPWISKKITLPTNFIHYSSFERERLASSYSQYFYSKEREIFIKQNGYDK